MRDAMPLPAIPGFLAGHQGTAMSMGTAPRPLALASLVVVVTDPDSVAATTVEIREGATTLLSATLPVAATEIQVTPSTRIPVYRDTELSMVVTSAGAEVMGLSGLLEVIPYG